MVLIGGVHRKSGSGHRLTTSKRGYQVGRLHRKYVPGQDRYIDDGVPSRVEYIEQLANTCLIASINQ